ncbi:hypothetical protein TVAG_429010 [Trichomonas vaginalis G3]|uniref:Phosphoprotein phosphatase n=1 Tax=Trichomonas vaginalis (strain ATCC PRA-98 / G3) TaxID=412133 RepID=A2FMB5_TRIV3|nr:hypothetical protein TVAG_429010 [Trichomonas vaginalis G3]|eukprot:XP_001306901.1 hypothetical protein [Trichomonas vaginalis G3]
MQKVQTKNQLYVKEDSLVRVFLHVNLLETKLRQFIIPISRTTQGISTPYHKVSRIGLSEVPDFIVPPQFHPLTPHAQIVYDLPPLIQRAFHFMDYSMCFHRDPFEADEPSEYSYEDFQKKTDTLNSILKIVTDPVSRHGLSPDVFRMLFEMVLKHIIHPLPKVSKEAEFSEYTITYYIKHWEHIVIVHQILRAMMFDHSHFSPLLSKQFSKKLVDCLETPLRSEQQQFEETIKIIIENYVGQRQHLLKHMISKLINYIENIIDYTSIGSILRLLVSYFLSLETPFSTNNHKIFRNLLFPLISTYDSSNFEKPIQDLELIFASQDPENAFWCLQYLFNHRPKTSVKKEILFYNLLTSLLPFLPDTLFLNTAPIVVKLLSRCISSSNVSVCLFAIMFCDNQDLINTFKPVPELVVKYLLPATKETLTSRDDDIKDYGTSLLNKLTPFDHQKTKNTENNEYLMKKWMQIANLAQLVETEEKLFISSMRSIYDN